jgi:hypothetical protein
MSYFEKPVDGTVAQQTDDAYLAYSGSHFIAVDAKSIRGHTGYPRASTVQGAHECRCKAPPSPKAGRWSLALCENVEAPGACGQKGGVASIQKTKETRFCPTTKRLEAFGTMRADFFMCGIGSDARGFLHDKGAVVSEAQVPFGQARPFQGGCDRSGGVE